MSRTMTLVMNEEAQESVCVDAPKVETPSAMASGFLVDIEVTPDSDQAHELWSLWDTLSFDKVASSADLPPQSGERGSLGASPVFFDSEASFRNDGLLSSLMS